MDSDANELYEKSRLRNKRIEDGGLEALLARIRMFEPLDARIERCKSMIGDMCAVGRSPKMSIPVDWDDEDLFITTTLNDAQNKIEDLEEEVKRLKVNISNKNREFAEILDAVEEAQDTIRTAQMLLRK